MKRLPPFAATLLALAFPAAATADPSPAPDDERKSIMLFEQARRLVEQGRCPLAIPMLEESSRLNPSPGAHLSLAQCYTEDDPTRAWREAKEAERIAAQKADPRAAYARSKAAALEPRIALVRIVMTRAGPSIEVRLDDKRVDPPETTLAVVPGSHVVDASAPSKKPWSQTVEAAIGTTATVNVALADDDRRGASPSPRAPEADHGGDRARLAGLITGGVGVAALGFGLFAGVVALGGKSRLENECGTPLPQCVGGRNDPAQANDDFDAAKRWATISTVGFVAGAVLIAAGAVLYFTAARGKAVQVTATGLEARF